MVICVSLRTAASAEAPLSPISLWKRLQRVGEVGRAREQACQRALTPKRTLVGSGALELGDSRLFEDCTKRGGALVSDEVVPETASKGRRGAVPEMSTGADTKANRCSGAAAHSSCWICVSSRTAASAEAPSGPMLLKERLPRGWAGAVREQVRVRGR